MNNTRQHYYPYGFIIGLLNALGILFRTGRELIVSNSICQEEDAENSLIVKAIRRARRVEERSVVNQHIKFTSCDFGYFFSGSLYVWNSLNTSLRQCQCTNLQLLHISDIGLQDVNVRPLEVGNSLCSILVPNKGEYCVSWVAAELVDKFKLNTIRSQLVRADWDRA